MREKILELKERGLKRKEICRDLKIIPSKYHSVLEGSDSYHSHRWTREQELKLMELYKVHQRRWSVIAEKINETFGTELDRVKVKNKYYRLRRKEKGQEPGCGGAAGGTEESHQQPAPGAPRLPGLDTHDQGLGDAGPYPPLLDIPTLDWESQESLGHPGRDTPIFRTTAAQY